MAANCRREGLVVYLRMEAAPASVAFLFAAFLNVVLVPAVVACAVAALGNVFGPAAADAVVGLGRIAWKVKRWRPGKT